MSKLEVTSPIIFKPIFQERIWGGRRLAELFGKKLPANKRIGESWEIVDRPDAQSVVKNGPLKGKTLHALWTRHHREIFGSVAKVRSRTGIARKARALPNRFPLLIKLLDAEDRLSLQVHPPENIAAKLGGEPKTECWYVAAADKGAQLFVGFRESISRGQFEKSLHAGSADLHVHTIPVRSGDAMFLPAGRFHAIGAGNVLIEVQQNSDTTYRVFDWNRVDEGGKPRQLHVEQALQCIDFDDAQPELVEAKGERLVKHDLFEIQKWNLDSPREVTARGEFAIVCCLTGSLSCAAAELGPGEFFLVPAYLRDRQLTPRAQGTSLLRIRIPKL